MASTTDLRQAQEDFFAVFHFNAPQRRAEAEKQAAVAKQCPWMKGVRL